MSGKAVIPREQAKRDIEDAVDFYLGEAGEAVAPRFVEALERAYRHLSRHPQTGSPRYAHELQLPELRSWTVKPFPHLIFYVEARDHVDVWRVLHGERDIPTWLREPR